jgi:predicted unusual protein kinase regulating ubiquinone biosynthesis (AarF/ABC1/UbiB family)
MSDDSLRRIDALLGVALRLARTAPSGRVALAQLAQTIEVEWIPEPAGVPIVEQLQAAVQEACQPLPLRQVERVLRDAWGAKPQDELDELDPEPVQVTPTAQVHRGVHQDRPVAIKVLRPGLSGSVRGDLALLETLAAPLAAAFPALDAAAVLREIRERTLDELDLESQAQTLRQFHRALRDHPLFLVPAPVTALAHESVVVSEWIEGVPLTEAEDRDGAAARLVLFALGAAEWGTAVAAIDPREVLVLPDGRIAIVDLASVRTVDRDRLALGRQVLEAFVTGDQAEFERGLSRLDLLPADLAATARELAEHALGPFAGAEPVRLDTAAVIAARDRVMERSEQLMALALAGRVAPEDLWPARGLAQLFSAIARTGATAPWRELVRAGLRDGWAARP